MEDINDVLSHDIGDVARGSDREQLDQCPIIDEHPVGSFGMYPGSLVKARLAVVVITARGEYIAYHDRPPTTRELVRKRVRFVSEVDMGHHRTQITGTVPAADDTFEFCVDMNLHWHVSEPRKVVRDGIRNVRTALQPLLLARIRPITRQFRPEESADAEEKVNVELARIPEAAEFGIEAEVVAILRMEDSVRNEFRLNRKVVAYRKIIAGGDLDQFAFTLAMKPEDASAVVTALVEERDRARTDTINFVTKLVESGAIERWQVADQIRVALQWLLDGSNRVITGTDEARPPSFGPEVLNPG